MNYKKSKAILKRIMSAENILISCHSRPDADSVASGLAMQLALKQLGKESLVVCVDSMPGEIDYLPNIEKVKGIDSKFEFSLYDLLLMLDVPTWGMVTGEKGEEPPEGVEIIQIDHHEPQISYGDLKITEPKVSSNCEVLCLLFQDWNIRIDKELASTLLTGIIDDTLSFRIPITSSRTLKFAADLMEKGADRQFISYRLFQTMEISLLKFMGEVLKRLIYEEEYRFSWSAVPFKIYKESGMPKGAKNKTANMFFGSIRDSDFGILMVEERENKLGVSFRSAGKFDTTKISEVLGGGGHHDSSAVKLENVDFDKAVQRVLSTAMNVVSNEK
jgi:phosphoesterase RecJ-like protein